MNGWRWELRSYSRAFTAASGPIWGSMPSPVAQCERDVQIFKWFIVLKDNSSIFFQISPCSPTFESIIFTKHIVLFFLKLLKYKSHWTMAKL